MTHLHCELTNEYNSINNKGWEERSGNSLCEETVQKSILFLLLLLQQPVMTTGGNYDSLFQSTDESSI